MIRFRDVWGRCIAVNKLCVTQVVQCIGNDAVQGVEGECWLLLVHGAPVPHVIRRRTALRILWELERLGELPGDEWKGKRR
jgi:hypothetical protein